MSWFRRRPLLSALLGVALLLTIVIGGYGLFLASDAGLLPWQPEPTLIPVTPFADFPGFGGSVTTPEATPGG